MSAAKTKHFSFRDEKSVYSSLSENLENIDTIIEKSGIDSAKVLVALTMLEMKGLISAGQAI
ncbi:MAG: hypothetical protein ACLR6O_04455 [Eubacterium sp.]